MSTADFELPIEFLRSRQNSKWNRYAADVIPAWVAEMDFSVAYPVQRAVERVVREQEYGYPMRLGGKAETAVMDAFAKRMKAMFGWEVSPDAVQPVADLVQGTFATLWAYTDPGEGVLLQVPAYPPFREAIAETGRRLVEHPIRPGTTRFDLDLPGMARAIDARTRVILLCHPHNPSGRVFDEAELREIGRIAIERDMVIVSDEIHSDLVFPGRAHIPLASLSSEIAARTVTITSPTKSFIMPGLRCAVLHFGSAALRERFHARVPRRMLGQVGITGIDATVAAWLHSQPWLDRVMAHLQRARDHVLGRLQREVPVIRCIAPEATYMAWLDCTALDLGPSAFVFFHDKARVAFSPGESFDAGCGQFLRVNFATSFRILDEIIDRMVAALRSAGRL